jgi:hypothetical protein
VTKAKEDECIDADDLLALQEAEYEMSNYVD